MSGRGEVKSGNIPVGDVSVGEVSVGEMSSRGTVLESYKQHKITETTTKKISIAL